MNKKAVSAHRDQDHGTRSIQVNDDDQNFATIDCNNLVIAADPWSPALFQEIFPQSTSVEPVIPAGDWFFFGNPQVDTSIAAVYLDENVLSQKPEFAGQNNITIWLLAPNAVSAKCLMLETSHSLCLISAKWKARAEHILKASA